MNPDPVIENTCNVGCVPDAGAASHESRLGSGLVVDYCDDWSHLTSLCPDWNSIVQDNRRLAMFSSTEWLSSWWGAFGNDSSLSAFRFSTGGRTIGIASFLRESARFVGRKQLNHLRLVGAASGDSDNLDLIVHPGWEFECAEALLRELAQRTDWDMCSLETLPSHSFIGSALPAMLGEMRWTHTVEQTPNWCVQLPSTWKEYLDSLSPDFRPLLTRYPKRLESRYDCKLSRCRTEEDIEKYLPVLFDLHAILPHN